MLNHRKDGLYIFDTFQVDFHLPKWKTRTDDNKNAYLHRALDRFMSERNGDDFISFSGPSFAVGAGATITAAGIAVGSVSGPPKKKSWFKRLLSKDKTPSITEPKEPNFTIEEIPVRKEEEPLMSVEEFFKSVKNSTEELQVIGDRIQKYEATLEYLKKTGQRALYEDMIARVESLRAETQLLAMGKTKLITEDQLVEFAKKCPKGLRLDWIQNFARMIPEKVVNEKIKADEKHIFDNYVVLHYDPYSKNTKLTDEEIQKKKDPILFGLIVGERKLYYVGDWIDEYCDLTFEKMIETLGEKAINANDITAQIKI